MSRIERINRVRDSIAFLQPFIRVEYARADEKRLLLSTQENLQRVLERLASGHQAMISRFAIEEVNRVITRIKARQTARQKEAKRARSFSVYID